MAAPLVVAAGITDSCRTGSLDAATASDFKGDRYSPNILARLGPNFTTFLPAGS